MKIVTSVSMALVLILAVGAWAAPTTCPPPRDWQPACMGAGPASQLLCLNGCSFDTAYVSSMYQQHSDVAALAAYGAGKVTDPFLKSFFDKIASERKDRNAALASTNTGCCPSGAGPANCQQASACECELSNYRGKGFDRAYVLAMIAMMRQTKQAADLAAAKATTPAMRDQARIVSRTSENEIGAMKRWLSTGFLSYQDWQRYCSYNYTNDPRCL